MNARELYQAGRLADAIEALTAEVRSNPTDGQRRTFLFELLCFTGQFDRAAKQLDVLGQGGQEAAMGMLLYRAALHAEQTRQQMFASGQLPLGTRDPAPVSGTMNGTPFSSLTDADPRVGARLEVFAAGEYLWLPLEHVESVTVPPPKRLRDLIWTPALVRPNRSFKGGELGEVLLPALAPGSWSNPDPQVQLGRVTEWVELDDGRQAPVGQKLLLVDDDDFPILEVRELQLTPVPSAAR
jgi:type VI secretion system protein ImpE